MPQKQNNKILFQGDGRSRHLLQTLTTSFTI